MPRTSKTYHLLCCHDNSLDAELATAHVKEIFQTWPEKIDDEDVVQALLSEVVYLGHAVCREQWMIRIE